MTDCRKPEGGVLKGEYDLVVVGAGSAGFAAAIAGAEQGASVALVGHGSLGGTCVNIGCVPSKTLIRAAQGLHDVRAVHRFAGLSAAGKLEDWNVLLDQKDELVADLRKKKYPDLLAAYDSIHYIAARARLVPGGVEIGGAQLRASRVIIATGARPAVPPIPGINEVEYLTSTSALALDRLPRSLLVLGGGYIGVELAQMFARLGVKLTIICRSRLLPAGEPEISEALSRYFRDEGIGLDCGITYRGVRSAGRGVAVLVADGDGERILEAERLLVATGRVPNVEELGLEALGITQAKSGAIEVDDHLRTNRPGVYAAGDVSTKDQFVYMAAYGANLAALNALTGDTHR
jgi:mercuric reductase